MPETKDSKDSALTEQIDKLQEEIKKLAEKMPEFKPKTPDKEIAPAPAPVPAPAPAAKPAEPKVPKTGDEVDVDIDKLVAEKLSLREKELVERTRKQLQDEQERNRLVGSILDSYKVTDAKERETLGAALKELDITSLKLREKDATLKEKERELLARPAPTTEQGKDRLFSVRQTGSLHVENPYNLTEEQKNLIVRKGLQQIFPTINFDATWEKDKLSPVKDTTKELLKAIRKREGMEP